MEKNYDSLFNLKYQDLVHYIVNRTRQAAFAVPELRDCKNGCIRITMVPLSTLAEAWLGDGLSDFGTFPVSGVKDVCEREFIYKINPEGSHTIQFVCKDGSKVSVNCYGYSALKVAYASWKRNFDEWAVKNNIPEALEATELREKLQYMIPDNGYAIDGGVIFTTIKLDGVDFMRVYVTVSGAQSGNDDQHCSIAGVLGLKEYCISASNYVTLPENTTHNFQLEPDLTYIVD